MLDTWLGAPDDFLHAPILDRLPQGVDGEGVRSALALAAQRTFQDLYAHSADLAGGSDERAFFEALSSGHEAEV